LGKERIVGPVVVIGRDWLDDCAAVWDVDLAVSSRRGNTGTMADGGRVRSRLTRYIVMKKLQPALAW
jgi:hypothetical protein